MIMVWQQLKDSFFDKCFRDIIIDKSETQFSLTPDCFGHKNIVSTS